MRLRAGIVIAMGVAWMATGEPARAQTWQPPTTAPQTQPGQSSQPPRSSRRRATQTPAQPQAQPPSRGGRGAGTPSTPRYGSYGQAAPYTPSRGSSRAAGPVYTPPATQPGGRGGRYGPAGAPAPGTYPGRGGSGPSRQSAPTGGPGSRYPSGPAGPASYPPRPGSGPAPYPARPSGGYAPYPGDRAPYPVTPAPMPAPVAPRPTTMPGAQPLPVDWPAAINAARSFDNNRALAGGRGFVAANRAAIDSLNVPFVLFDDPDLLPGLRLFANGDFYTLSSSSHGLSVVLTGYSRAYPLPDKADVSLPQGGLKARIPADGVVVQSTEAGLDADFTRFGAVYGLSVECADGEADWRCKDDAYLRGLLRRTAVVIPHEGH